MGQEDPLMGQEDLLMGLEKSLMGQEDPLVGQEDPLVGQEDLLMGQKDHLWGRRTTYGAGGPTLVLSSRRRLAPHGAAQENSMAPPKGFQHQRHPWGGGGQ